MIDSIKRKIQNIIIKQLAIKLEDLKDTSSFIEDLGADSLDTVELIMTLEEELDIEINDQAAENIRTAQDIYNYIEQYKKQ